MKKYSKLIGGAIGLALGAGLRALGLDLGSEELTQAVNALMGLLGLYVAPANET